MDDLLTSVGPSAGTSLSLPSPLGRTEGPAGLVGIPGSVAVTLEQHAGHCADLSAEGLHTPLVEAARAYANAARLEGNDPREVEALALLANAAQHCGQFNVAIEAQQREAEVRARNGDREGQADCLNNIGMLWANLGSYAEALAALYQSQQLCDQYVEIPDDGTCSVNIGHIYLNMGHAPQALSFLEPGLLKARRGGNLETEVAAMSMLGLAHKDLRHFREATETLHQAIDLARTHHLMHHLIDLHDNLGQVHLDQGELTQAEEMFRQSLYWAVEVQDMQGKVNALLSLGRLEFEQQHKDEAEHHLLEALDIANAHELRSAKLTILEALFSGLEHLGLLSEAYPYLREYRRLERQLVTEEGERHTQSLTARFEAERARRETEMYRQLNESAQQARLQAEETVRVRTAELEAVQIEIVTRLGMAAEYRDDKTGQHTRRVGELSAHLAQAMALPPEEVDLIRWAARLHDIGKIGVEDAILLKTGRYSAEEYERMKQHTVIGAKVLEGSTSRLLRMAEEIALTHHERWDGSGYPRGLRAGEIPITGRIVAVADVFDALTTQRPYKEAWSVSDALTEMQRHSGTQFDPDVIDRLLTLVSSNQASLVPLLTPRKVAPNHSPTASARHTLEHAEALELLERAWELRPSDPKTGAELAARGMELARVGHDDHLLGLAHRTAGYYRYTAGEYEEALNHLSQGLDIGILCDDQGLQADCANFIAAVYANLHDFEKATDQLAVVLRIARETNDHLREAHCLNNLGYLSYSNRDLPKSREFRLESLDLNRALDNKLGQAQALIGLANIAFDLGEAAEAVSAAHAAAALAHQAGNTETKNIATSIAGKAAARLGDPARGKQLLTEAIEEAHTAEFLGLAAQAHLDLGQIHHQLGEWKQARENYEKALLLAQQHGRKDVVMETLLHLSELCAQEGRHQDAFELYRQHHDVEREIHNQTVAMQTRALMTQLEVERAKSEAQIYRLKTIELASANEALERLNSEKSGLVHMLEEQSRLLERQLSEDGLTGLFNRKHIEGVLQHEFLNGRVTRRPLSIAMADIDHFKQINDQFSHLVGDQVLRTVAQLFQSAVRPSDAIGRYGGEEFLFVFPNTSLIHAQRVCERVQTMIHDFDWTQLHPNLNVTLSIGVSADPQVANHEKLISLADEQLYEAKRSGRDRICLAAQ